MNKPSLREIFKKKEVQPGKEVKLEKGDFLALVIACASVFVPYIMSFAVLFLVVILLWGAFFG